MQDAAMARIAARMANSETVLGADELLRLFLSTPDISESEFFLETLLTQHAQPQIQRIARKKLSFLGTAEYQDVDDISSEVVSELLRRLRELRDSGDSDTIKSFAAYTATTTYRAYNDYLRKKYPQRHRLKAQLRYVLGSNVRFSLWEDAAGTWLCGYRKWMGSNAVGIPATAEFPEQFLTAAPPDMLACLFDTAGGPLEFDDVVSTVVDLKGLRDWPGEPQELDELPSTAQETNVLEKLQNRQWLSRLWKEICALPLPQRKALLLNLRADEGDSALALVPLAGIASIRQIAGMLEMAAEELAALWNRLPIDDIAIAAQLGLTRQQVINLRKSARERLARRMAAGTGW